MASASTRCATGCAASTRTRPSWGSTITRSAKRPKKSAVDRKAQARKVVAALRTLYPQAHCELDFKTPLQLIVATILSAQCTDKRVNMVTPELFRRFPDARSLAAAETPELESIIRSTGFYRAKAKSISETARALLRDFKSRVPDTMEELLTLRGVARKTANVVLGTAYGKAEGVVVDTHIKRVSFRLGLTDETDPGKVEKDLMDLLPRDQWIYFGHALIWHGRRVCKAPAPDCENCLMKTFCPRRGVV